MDKRNINNLSKMSRNYKDEASGTYKQRHDLALTKMWLISGPSTWISVYFLLCVIRLDMIGIRTRAPKSTEGKMVNGRETLRLRSKGAATVQEVVSLKLFIYHQDVLEQWHVNINTPTGDTDIDESYRQKVCVKVNYLVAIFFLPCGN